MLTNRIEKSCARIPQYALESSIANNFGMGFEQGPQTTTISKQIVIVFSNRIFGPFKVMYASNIV
jgi:hypothetical protein